MTVLWEFRELSPSFSEKIHTEAQIESQPKSVLEYQILYSLQVCPESGRADGITDVCFRGIICLFLIKLF